MSRPATRKQISYLNRMLRRTGTATLTRDLRYTLKQRVDAAMRATLPDVPTCRGCGLELLDPFSEEPRYLVGYDLHDRVLACGTCWDRKRARRVRAAGGLR